MRPSAGGLPVSETPPDDGSPSTDQPAAFGHEPVMVAEIVELFEPVPAGWLIDATVGGGGHAEALLESHPQLSILGLDRDEDAIAATTDRLSRFGDRVRLLHLRFDLLHHAVTTTAVAPITGVLFDLGVSSHQIDRADRGFSYRQDGPLDMRMDQRDPVSAADLVNTLDGRELAQLLRRFGDERHANRIADAIVAARPISTTAQLVAIIDTAVPAAAHRSGGGHVAKRTFQALRIVVNDELAVLESALAQALGLVSAGGRVGALTYHSGEDRLVKQQFATATAGPDLPRGLPVTGSDADRAAFRLVHRGGRKPSAAEVDRNRRAASARLRDVERRPGVSWT